MEYDVQQAAKKCSRSKRDKFFKAPFHRENYKLNVERMHPIKWCPYGDLTEKARATIFDIRSSVCSQVTLHAFNGYQPLAIRALVDNPIVEVIVSEMMTHPEDTDEIFRESSLVSFEATLDLSEGDDASPISRYVTTVNNPKSLLRSHSIWREDCLF